MTADSRDRDGRLAYVGGGLVVSGSGPVEPSVVGAKAANLIRLTRAGLPVPPGFVLSTAICAEYHRLGRLGSDVAELTASGMARIERETGRRFGAHRRPLLVAVRSGAPTSMPGMLDTILNVGLCDGSLEGLLTSTGDPAFAWNSYLRLIRCYAEVVDGWSPEPFQEEVDAALTRFGVPDISELDVESLRRLVSRLQGVYSALAGRPFPQDPHEQLVRAVEAVLRSWYSERAVAYRRLEGLPDRPGTAVTVQAMVFGNLGSRSGSGVAFTRDPATGRNEIYLDFIPDVQGEDVVSGRRSAASSGWMAATVPGLDHELQRVRLTLEEVFGDVQDFEFTVEGGKLWILQTRAAKRTPLAALRIACDQVNEGLIHPDEALQRLNGYDLDQIKVIHLDQAPGVHPVGSATPASTGACAGITALDADNAIRLADQGQAVILVREQASTADISALARCRGLLTSTGSRTSHPAVVARDLGVVCLVGCSVLSVHPDGRRFRIGNEQFQERDPITLDGYTGLVYPGLLRTVEERPTELLDRVRAWRSAPTDAPADRRAPLSRPPG